MYMYILKIFFFTNVLKPFLKKEYDPVILQHTSRLFIDPSLIDSYGIQFCCAVTDIVKYFMIVYL